MMEDKLVAALNELASLPEDPLESLAGAKNAALETRVAAILLVVGLSDLPIASATVELVQCLTEPERFEPDADPAEKPVDRIS